VPWVAMTMLPGSQAGAVPSKVSLVPLRDLLTGTPSAVALWICPRHARSNITRSESYPAVACDDIVSRASILRDEDRLDPNSSCAWDGAQ
jgi:hypothetical protein